MAAFLLSSQLNFVVSFPGDPLDKVADGVQQMMRWGTVVNVALPNTDTNTIQNRLLINFGHLTSPLVNEDAPEDDSRFVVPLAFDDMWQQAVKQEDNRLRLDNEGPAYL